MKTKGYVKRSKTSKKKRSKAALSAAFFHYQSNPMEMSLTSASNLSRMATISFCLDRGGMGTGYSIDLFLLPLWTNSAEASIKSVLLSFLLFFKTMMQVAMPLPKKDRAEVVSPHQYSCYLSDIFESSARLRPDKAHLIILLIYFLPLFLNTTLWRMVRLFLKFPYFNFPLFIYFIRVKSVL